jgi:hypothetical protein
MLRAIQNMKLTSSQGEPIKMQPTFSYIWLCAHVYPLTGCRQHLFTCEHGVCPGHETHCLLVLAQCLPTCRESDDRRRKNDS